MWLLQRVRQYWKAVLKITFVAMHDSNVYYFDKNTYEHCTNNHFITAR